MKGCARSTCLLAMLAIVSCTSSERLTPPGEIGASGPATTAPGAFAAAPKFATGADQPVVAAQLAAATAPAFAGTEPSTSVAPQGDVGPIAAVAPASTIQIVPVTGSTEQAVAPLMQRLVARARERGLGIAGNGAAPTHALKGYLSEVSGAGSTTVIYVWDVVDSSGTRLHRIQGTAKVKGGRRTAVSAETMRAIADRTIDDLAQWLSRRSG